MVGNINANPCFALDLEKVTPNEAKATLVWIRSLKEVTCHSCAGNPWSADGGCGACSHVGYRYSDPRTGEQYKKPIIDMAEKTAKRSL